MSSIDTQERGTSRRGTAIRVAILLTLGAEFASPAYAQVRASERARVSQISDGTTITIDYARPRARGRTQLFGKTVTWGEVWTPGANWATTFDVSRDVTIDGHVVKKGKYSVWFVVQPEQWTVILDPRSERYHTEVPDSIPGQIRWSVKPAEGPATEILTWSFSEVRPDGMVLHFAWGTKQLSFDAVVIPSHPIPIAERDAAPFVGTYHWKWDPSVMNVEGEVTLYYENGRLKQKYDPFPKWYPSIQGMPMARINDSWFIPAFEKDGKVYEMDSDLTFEFEVKDGKAISFEVRDSKDLLMAKGTRVAPK